MASSAYTLDPNAEPVKDGEPGSPNPLSAWIPGFGMLDQAFDFTGKYAAQQSFENQKTLDSDAYLRNLASAREQREWEKMMDDTKFQRMVKDMEAAGLNPFLALSSLNSGGTPSGASASSTSGNAAMANNKLSAVAGILAVVLRVLIAKH